MLYKNIGISHYRDVTSHHYRKEAIYGKTLSVAKSIDQSAHGGSKGLWNSTEQYQIACNSIIKFGEANQVISYSPELVDSYMNDLDRRCPLGEICKEYRRFQLRVVHMLSSIVESGKVDFSSAKSPFRKYPVSEKTIKLVEKILDSYVSSDASKRELRAPTGISCGMQNNKA